MFDADGLAARVTGTFDTARRSTRALGVVLSMTVLMCAPWVARPARADAVELIGTWFVLVHYHDEHTANPEADRWLDLVWAFEMKGSRLEWREYPIVVFEDTGGRFEAIPGNARSRTLAAWEPNEAQRETIADGPRVNDRGSTTKTLRGSQERGWKSSQRPQMQTSAMVVGYQKVLEIADPTGMPEFVRADVLGGAQRKSAEGRTTYHVTGVHNGGRTLTGDYQRDGRQRGTFRMWRTPPVRGLTVKEGTPNERAYERALEGAGDGGGPLGGDRDDDDDF